MTGNGVPQVVISGMGVVTPQGEGPAWLENIDSPRKPPTEEEIEQDLVVPVGRLGRLKKHPFCSRFERMSQLDAFSQYGFIAAGYALDSAGIPAPDERFSDVGVMIGTCFGCQEANAQFDQFTLDPVAGPQDVRPALFKNTVDNVPAGWIALGYKLLGVNATYVSGRASGAEALLSAQWALQAQRSRHIVAGGVERLLPLQLVAQYRHPAGPPEPFAAEGAAIVALELETTARDRGHPPLARITAATCLPCNEPQGLCRWLDEVCLEKETIELVSIVCPPGNARAELRRRMVAAGFPDRSILIESERTGDMYAAQAPLALIFLVRRLASTGGHGLLCVESEMGDQFVFVIES